MANQFTGTVKSFGNLVFRSRTFATVQKRRRTEVQPAQTSVQCRGASVWLVVRVCSDR